MLPQTYLKGFRFAIRHLAKLWYDKLRSTSYGRLSFVIVKVSQCDRLRFGGKI